jgi:hypothetical protein
MLAKLGVQSVKKC